MEGLRVKVVPTRLFGTPPGDETSRRSIKIQMEAYVCAGGVSPKTRSLHPTGAGVAKSRSLDPTGGGVAQDSKPAALALVTQVESSKPLPTPI